MTTAAAARSPGDVAAGARRSRQLDLFRGLAALCMIVNHAGNQLLRGEAFAGGWPTWLVFVGSAAPALYFFASGVGSGLSRSDGDGPGGMLRKVVLLLLADLLLNWSTGIVLGFDFFGFAALSTAVLFLVRRSKAPERVATLLVLAVLAARYGLAPIARGGIPAGSFLAFITGIEPVDHVSYPLGPWLAFPLLGFLVGRRWPEEGVALELRVVGGAAIACLAVSVALAARGAPVFRWGSVSLAYFLCAIAIVGVAWLGAGRACRAAPRGFQGAFLRGPASLLVVPLHYGLLGLLEAISAPPWSPAAWATATAILAMAVFFLARSLVAGAGRLPVPAGVTQVAVAATACLAAGGAFVQGGPLVRLELCSVGQVVVALLLLWSTRPRSAPGSPALASA